MNFRPELAKAVMDGRKWRVIEADCIDAMREMDEASVDAIVCDPPYGIGFMGKEWDGKAIAEAAKRDRETRQSLGPHSASRPGRAQPRSSSAFGNEAIIAGPVRGGRAFQDWCEQWATEALRVLKPGGHLLAFGGTRTYHRLACAIEDAGFKIRDCLAWLYGSGFPKSHNLDGDWQGWGTALKPAHEPIVVARKPLIGTVAENVQQHGTGALNIDGCRIAGDMTGANYGGRQKSSIGYGGTDADGSFATQEHPKGRWPANVVLDAEAAAMLDEQSGQSRSRAGQPRTGANGDGWGMRATGAEYDDEGGASRFFYCAKAGKGEREAGLEAFAAVERVNGNKWTDEDYRVKSGERPPSAESGPRRNVHPTVKPIALMRWLVRLVTPPGGTVLDPFAGSGTTGCAAVLEGFDFIGIEREPDYAAIARARIEFWSGHEGQDTEAVLAADARARKLRKAGQESLLEEAA